MILTVVDLIASALATTLPAALLASPGGAAVPLIIEPTDDIADDRDPSALLRIEAQDAISLTYPLEADDPATLTVAFTVTLRRADIPSLVTATRQHMRRAVDKCERAVARALLQAFDVVHFGQIEGSGLVVRCPREITIAEPDTETEETITSGTVTAVFVIEDRHVLTRNG